MRAEVVSMDAKHPDKEAIKRAGQILQNGGLVAFPTETVYGLGGNALDPRASMKIYAAKGRPSDNPLIIHIADMSSLPKIVSEIPAKAQLLAEKFWPGPLTMICCGSKRKHIGPSKSYQSRACGRGPWRCH